MNKIDFIAIAGDSGGHVLPAIKFINELSKIRNPISILFITNKTGAKFLNHINNENVKICEVSSNNKISYTLNIIRYLSPILMRNKKIKLIGFGGFITLPVLFLSKFFNIFFSKLNKIFIHEQNYIFGLANKINYKISDIAFTSFPSKNLNKKEIFVGNFFYDLSKNVEKLDNKFINILLLGGSAGSLDLNNLLLKELESIDSNLISKIRLSVQIPHTHHSHFRDKYLKLLKNLSFFEFNNKLNYSDYDLIISRSGSGSLNDILYFSNSVFFSPHLHSRDGHQLLNLNFFKKYNNLPNLLEIPHTKKEINNHYFNSLINPYSINKIVCYLAR